MQYQFFPALSDEEYQNLKADIAARGVMVPVEKDEQGNTLDGTHREQICRELGITDYPVTIRAGMSEDEKVEHAVTLNIARRHLTGDQRRDVVMKLRQQQWSTPRIAAKLGVSDETVRRDLNSVSTNVEIELPETVVTSNGKTYPARRPTTIVAKTQGEAAAAAKALHGHGLPNEQTSFTAAEILTDAAATNGHAAALQREGKAQSERNQSPLYSSDTYEWYTPPHIIERARLVLGSIELDPCTSEQANQCVQAQEFYTASDDGLSQRWNGVVWLNPPYGDTIAYWTNKLRDEYLAGRITKALALVPARTDTVWFNAMREFPRCFLKGRLKFTGPDADTEGNSAPFPSCVIALGCDVGEFAEAFNDLGDVYVLAAQKPQEA